MVSNPLGESLTWVTYFAAHPLNAANLLIILSYTLFIVFTRMDWVDEGASNAAMGFSRSWNQVTERIKFLTDDQPAKIVVSGKIMLFFVAIWYGSLFTAETIRWAWWLGLLVCVLMFLGVLFPLAWRAQSSRVQQDELKKVTSEHHENSNSSPKKKSVHVHVFVATFLAIAVFSAGLLWQYSLLSSFIAGCTAFALGLLVNLLNGKSRRASSLVVVTLIALVAVAGLTFGILSPIQPEYIPSMGTLLWIILVVYTLQWFGPVIQQVATTVASVLASGLLIVFVLERLGVVIF